jgi:TetR/AcrR family transcriptional repressor of nem operon
MSRPKEFDETSALDRAMELFWDQGYEGTSLAVLERHLGIGRQSIYDTYGNKLGLYHKALDRYSRVPVTHLLGRLEAGGHQAIRSFFERLLAYQSCPRPPACFMVNSAIELAPRDHGVRLRVNEHFRRLEAGFRAAFTKAGSDRGLSGLGRTDPRAAASLLTCAALGLLVAAKGGVPPGILHQMANAALTSVGVEILD